MGAARRGRWKWPAAAAVAGALLLSGFGGAGAAFARLDSPVVALSLSQNLRLAGRVTDAAHILAPKDVAALDLYLRRFEERTRHQMVVVTVPSLGGEDVADFTRSLANRRGVGRKGVDDGVVVLVAPNERKVRIQVGYGLEKLLTNAYCKHVIDTMMVPKFRDRRYYDGIILGVTGLARVARRV